MLAIIFFKFSFQVVNYQVFRLMHKIHCYKDMQHSLYLYNSVNYASLKKGVCIMANLLTENGGFHVKKKKCSV